jgi:hypothetical protein
MMDLTHAAATRGELSDGCRLTFAASSATLDLIARTIDAERQCCRFLTFRLTIEPDLGAFVLDVRGPSGTREFLRDVIGGGDEQHSA